MNDNPALLAAQLSARDTHPLAVTRRRFLQAAAALGGFAALERSPFGSMAAAAAPLSGADGVLVLVNLQGGNDALNTLVPYGTAAYHDLRGPVAIDPAAVHVLDGEVGLHPSLTYLKQRWDDGRLAVVQGVGDPDPDLSHFTSMARWMSGSTATAPTTGWLGRYLDHLGTPEAFDAVTIGSEVPLTLIGAGRRATALGETPGSFGTSDDENERRLYSAVRDMAAGASDRGVWADALARSGRDMVDVNATVAPLYAPEITGDDASVDLELAARLLNADLGVRVVNVTLTGFDTHADQLGWHATLLHRLDAGLARFFSVLQSRLVGRVTVLVVSEFGRQPAANDSAGTDHGTAGVAFVLGAQVRGGRYGALPSLTDLGRWDRLRTPLDQRSLFATVLGAWLGADDTQIMGARYEHLDVFLGAPTGGAGGGGGGGGVTPVTPPVATGFIEAVRPRRLLDTRDGTGGTLGPVAGGSAVELDITGASGAAPAGTTTVLLNVTVTEPSAPGYITVWPSGNERPLASCLNFVPGQTVPNLVVATVGANGAVSLFNSAGRAHLVADLVGYVGPTPGATFVPVVPFRLLDTRTGDGAVRAGEERLVPVAGRLDVPASGVVGVVANVTVAEPTASGFLTVWPAGTERPLASNLNFSAGQVVPNLVVAKLGDGAVQLYVPAGSAHVVIDVVGLLVSASSGSHLRSAVPTRVLDSRDGTGGGRRLGADESLDLVVAGVAGVPATARAVALNVTAVQPTAAGWVTVWPAGHDRPDTSNLNVVAGRDVANLVVTMVGADGKVSLANARGHLDLVADVVGWFD